MSESLVQILGNVGDRIEGISNDRYRHALKYQYLIGRNAAEVSGDFTPKGSDMYEIEHKIGGRIVPTGVVIGR